MTRTRYAALVIAALSLAGAGAAWAAGGEEIITAATGGEGISADMAGGAWTTLTGPVITETMAKDTGGPGLGTIVLNVPDGFEFNPDASVSVLVTADFKKSINRIPDGGEIPIVVTRTNITITITQLSRGGSKWPDSLTYQGIQVRPTAGFPLASGHITESGTCDFRNLSLTSGTWGYLQEVGGTLVGYQIIGNGSTTAGTPETITIQKVDQFGNPLPDSTTETLIFSGLGTIGTYAPTINGSTDAFTTGIQVTFDENGTSTTTLTLIDFKAETATLELTDGAVGTGSIDGGLAMSVDPGQANTLLLSGAPGSMVYGSSFSVVVITMDQYGNISTTGLGSNVDVTLGLTGGSGSLIGGIAQNIGTAGGNGTASFGGLQVDAAGESYVLSAIANGFTAGTINLSVAKAIVIPNVTVQNKVYDGGTGAVIGSRTLAGVVGADDVNLGLSGAAAFADKHVGLAKPVMVSGLVLNGAAAGNYQLSADSVATTASISKRGVGVVPAAHRKNYDGTVMSSGTPEIAVGSLAVGDSGTFTQCFADKAAGTGKMLIPSATISDGNSGQNYSLSINPQDVGEIDPTPITVMAAADSKVYDGTTSSTGVPIITSGALIAGDTAGFTQSFDTKNVGTGKTLIPAGIVNDGNGGNNYAVTFVSVNTGIITAREITVTAVTDSKPYDGTTSSGATPVVTGGGIAPGDVANFTQGFDSKTVGSDITLTPGGAVNDGNGGSNYTVTFVPTAGGTISSRSLAVTATAADKIYDGTVAATVTLSDNRVAGDNLNLSYGSASFENPSIGTSKPVSVSGIAVSGADAANYTHNSTATTAAAITAATLTVTANHQTRSYGAANPELTGTLSGVQHGDNITASYSTLAQASSPVGSYNIVPALNDPDGKLANYIVSLNNGTLIVGQTALSVVADNQSRAYGAANPELTGSLVGLMNGDNITASYSTDAQEGSSAGSYAIVPALNDPDSKLANYSVSMVNGTLTVTSGATTTAVDTSSPIIVEGSSVTFTATVTSSVTGVPGPTGSIQFLFNGAPLGGLVALSGETASLTTSSVTPGSNTVSAVYAGDSNFASSTGTVIQVVQKNIQTLRILSVVTDDNGMATVTFEGVPGSQYLVQATPSLTPTSWTTISTNNAGFIDGQWTYIDDTTKYSQRFFRAAKP